MKWEAIEGLEKTVVGEHKEGILEEMRLVSYVANVAGVKPLGV